jgi:hypothetical protein
MYSIQGISDNLVFSSAGVKKNTEKHFNFRQRIVGLASFAGIDFVNPSNNPGESRDVCGGDYCRAYLIRKYLDFIMM